MTPVEIFNCLTPAEKRKALAILQTSERSPCERVGHKFKAVSKVERWFFPPLTRLVCTACGQSITR
jgi:hypothetical protein